ncbi:MAG: hypothetical protein APF82_03410 [Sphingomonadales bacterium BRH_c42]|nr:MAG: hypothetical protein APF82_03410 [Sphingomonadales bacterium BRH_c42]
MTAEDSHEERTFSPQAIHLVRTVTQTNLALSQMADQKASLLMGAAFVVFTLAVGQASRGSVSPTLMVLGLFAFLAACLAVAAVLPSVSPKPVADNQPNILFFGVFTGMDEEDFADRVIDRLGSDEDIFRVMLRDIYQNGQVLYRKKYRLLGWSYRMFIAGLTLSLASFVFEQRAALMAFG